MNWFESSNTFLKGVLGLPLSSMGDSRFWSDSSDICWKWSFLFPQSCPICGKELLLFSFQTQNPALDVSGAFPPTAVGHTGGGQNGKITDSIKQAWQLRNPQNEVLWEIRHIIDCNSSNLRLGLMTQLSGDEKFLPFVTSTSFDPVDCLN